MENNNQISSTSVGKKGFPKVLLIVLLIVGFITTFGSGYFLSRLLSQEQTGQMGKVAVPTVGPTSLPNTTPYPTSNNPVAPQETTKFLPGKHYFEDTIMLVSKDKPQLDLIATSDRLEQSGNYTQNVRVSYYDGSNWDRKSDNKTIPDSTITSNSLIKSWVTTTDPSRVLKESSQGEVTVNGSTLGFSSGPLQNEIGIRSLPGYTKFISQGSGSLTVNGVSHPAYILYTRIYSLNSSDIQFYDQPFGLTTDWIAFWDSAGNFYHVDATSVDKPTKIYQTHQVGVMEDANGSVTKSFSVATTRDSKSPPTQYTVNINNPISAVLSFTRVNGVNKAPNGSYVWYMGNVEGSVVRNGQTLNGVGLIEYIHD